MFTKPLNALLIFMVTTPVIGWVTYKSRYRKIRGLYAVLGLSVTAYFLYEMYMEVSKKGNLQSCSLPFEACLEIDVLSVFMALVYVMIGILAAAYSIRYMERDTGLTEYYTLLLGMVAGMMGVAFAGDFFTLFVFWELMSLTSYALVAFRKERWEPIEAGFKYLIMSAAGGATILLAMSFLYGMTGTLNFADLAARLSGVAPNEWLYVALALIVVGFGVKAAIVPFHTWLPDAHPAAPAPISALLSGALVQTGAYALIRVLLLVFGSMQTVWQMTLVVFAVLTMFVGNLMALLQDDIKRLLAFSTIAQMGYILFGFSIASQQALTGSFFHIMNHAIMKSLLFLCAGGFIYRTGTRTLTELAGIRQKMPMTSLLLAIGAVAIAAIPPLNGFWSEWMIVLAGIEANMLPFSALMIINILLSVAYYLRLINVIVLKEPTPVSERATRAPLSMLIPILILAALCIIIGIYPGPFIALAEVAAKAVLGL
ncbi:MAG: complex I subunit 5 family protein [Candidatus Bathyarchaeia archaeon]